jgi:3-hydroxybutyryl-CoA dehydrogenase
LFSARGSTVSVRINRGSSTADLPRGTKKVQKLPRTADIALELTNLDPAQKRTNILELDRALAKGVPILSSSVTVTAGEQSSWVSRPDMLVGFGALPSMTSADLIEFAPSSSSGEKAVGAASAMAKFLGKESAIVKDAIGLVFPRILCCLANEACFALGENVASARDIDTAMMLGTNYPSGPIEWAQRIGPRHVHAVMEALHRFLGEERYRPAPLLSMAAFRNSFSGLI